MTKEEWVNKLKHDKDTPIFVKHPKVIKFLEELQYLLDTNGANGDRGLFAYGCTGTGKTTAINYFCKMYPQIHERDREVFPVVRLDCPDSTTPKWLASEILKAYRHPAYNKGTFYDRRERVLGCISKCGTKLLIIDESQHMVTSESGRPNVKIMENLDYVKELLNLARVPIVLVGTEDALPIFVANLQIARRFRKQYHLTAFKNDEEFRSLLRTIEQKLLLEKPSYLGSKKKAGIIWKTTRGLISEVMGLLIAATIEAIETGTEQITPRLLEKCRGKVHDMSSKNAKVPFSGAYE